MRRKCYILGIVSFVISIAIYLFTYCLYHYLGPEGCFENVFQTTPVKPLLTLYFGIWGVMHQFAAVMSLLIGILFFPKEKK